MSYDLLLLTHERIYNAVYIEESWPMPPTMSPVYIPCEVRDGLFSNEYAVTVRDVTGESVSFFADRGLVKIEKQTLLRVRFVGEESPAGTSSCFQGQRWMPSSATFVSARTNSFSPHDSLEC